MKTRNWVFMAFVVLVSICFLAACGGGGGGGTGGTDPAPTASIWADNLSILEGGSTRIRWATSGGIAYGSWDTNPLPASGSVVVSPTSDTAYTVGCGTAEDSVTITVTPTYRLLAGDGINRVRNGALGIISVASRVVSSVLYGVAAGFNDNGTGAFADASLEGDAHDVTEFGGNRYVARLYRADGIYTNPGDVYFDMYNSQGAFVKSLLVGTNLYVTAITANANGVYATVNAGGNASSIRKADLNLNSVSQFATYDGTLLDIVTSGGQVFVAGFEWYSGYRRAMLAQFATNGQLVGSGPCLISGKTETIAEAVSMAPNGSIWITGSARTTTTEDAFLGRFDGFGPGNIFTSFLIGSGVRGKDLDFDQNGRIYAATNGGTNIGPICFDPVLQQVEWSGARPANSIAVRGNKVFQPNGETFHIFDIDGIVIR